MGPPRRPEILVSMKPTVTIYACALVGLFVSSSLLAAASDSDGQPSLPPLWSETRDKIITGSFRIMSEIRIGDSSFLAEEWADMDWRLYRFDFVPLEINKQTGRRTLLVNGTSNERHFIEPFKCRLLNNTLADEPLFKVFPRNHGFILSGLGAIWAHALGPAKRASFKAAAPPKAQPEGAKRPARTVGELLAGYDRFTLEADDRFPYRILFYFGRSTNRAEEPKGAILLEELIAIHLVDPQSLQVKMSAKIIEVNGLIGAYFMVNKQPNLFALPLGYGCVRADDTPLSVLTGGLTSAKQSFDCFPAAEGPARRSAVCNVQVVAALPLNPNDDMDKWKIHTSSLRFTSGKLAERSYVVQERRDFAPIDERPTVGLWDQLDRKYVVRRTRRIWELAEGPVSEDSGGEKSTIFELSVQSKSCNSVFSARLAEVALVEVPLALAAPARASLQEGGEPFGGGPLGGLSLDPAMMRELFLSSQGYHLIRENIDMLYKYKQFTLEKRVEKFQLRGNANDPLPLWTGPASIVRQIAMVDKNFDQMRALADELDIHVDIYLLTEARDKMLAHIHLQLSPRQLMDEAYLHRDVDIGLCLLAYNRAPDASNGPLGLAAWGPAGPMPRGALGFVITYPLELDGEIGGMVSQMEEEIYGQFLAKLIGLSAQKLDPLQVNGLTVDIEPDSIKIAGTLNKWPGLFDFIKTAGVKFTPAGERALLLTSELKANEAECAASCSHLGCPKFVYCARTRICQLAAADRLSSQPTALMLEPAEGCSLWRRRRAEQPERPTPGQLFAKMRQAVVSTDGDHDLDEDEHKQHPLAIQLELAASSQTLNASSRPLLLLPDAINIDTENTPDRNLAHGLHNDDDDDVDYDQLLHVEYEILFPGRKLIRATGDQEAFPLEEATHTDYEACERLCRENDCKSFSHCQVEQTCLISQLVQGKQIEKNSKQDDFCFLLGRIQLSKFHKIANVPAPNDVEDGAEDGGSQTAIIRRQQAGSSRDCAIECLDNNADTQSVCKSFYFCSSSPHDCILMSDRQSQTVGQARDEHEANGAPPCDLYQRSHLADYDRLPAKQFNAELINQAAEGSISLLLGLDADGCASECVHSTDSCLAFHVCAQAEAGAAAGHQIHCAILAGAAAGPAAGRRLRGDLKSGRLLSEAQMCTTFVRKPERAASEPALAAPTAGGDSRWPPSALVFVLALVAGYGLTWLLAIQDSRLSAGLMRLRHLHELARR